MENYTEKVRTIIALEKDYLDRVANEWMEGNEDFANKQMHRLFIKYGWTSDTQETYQLLDYVGNLIGLFMKQGVVIWKQIPSYSGYECTQSGNVRRIGGHNNLKVENDRVKLSVNGRQTVVRVSDLIYETFFNNEETEANIDMMLAISSDL